MLSCALLASACPGGGQILGCVLAPCAVGPALLDLRSGCAAASLQSRRPSPSELVPATQPPPRSRRPNPSKLLLEPCSPLHTESLPQPEPLSPSCSWGCAAPSAQSRCPSPSNLLPGQCVCAAALRELGALSWVSKCLLVSQGAQGHPRRPGVLF